MRIVYVAGFFTPVLQDLQANVRHYLKSRAVVWIPQFSQGDLDLRRFKADLFQVVSRGASEVLVCLFLFRGSREESTRMTLEAILDEARDRSPALKIVVERAQSARDSKWVLSKIRQFDPSVEPPLPTELDGLEDWVLERHESRILLHPRAIQAAKKSQYEDVSLIYAAINLLATEYWNIRSAVPERRTEMHELCSARLAALGLQLSPSITASRAGEKDDEYFVAFPLGSDKKRMLDHHLKKGSDREERLCLRIYFFWDDDLHRVVIGWLPSHLGTRTT